MEGKMETADLEIHITTTHQAGGSQISFVLHSAMGKVPYTRFPIQSPTTLPESLSDYSTRKLQIFRDLDDPRHVAKHAPGGLERELSALGQELYRDLVPEALQLAYREFRKRITTLLIVSNDPWIPWELIKPSGDGFEDDFLCCQFDLSRWLTGQTAPATDFGADEIGANRIAVIEAGEVPRASVLRHAKDEGRFLQEFAARHGGVEARVLADARYEQVDRLLTDGGCGVLHFVGHGMFQERDPNASLFLLADGRSFRPRDLYGPIEIRMRKDRPLVVFNSCQAARQAPAVTRLAGWVPHWILDCGCGAFLGPVWEVDDAQAASFARSFYTALEDGATVAAATRQARLQVRQEFSDVTGWLAYTVYAHPGARLRLGMGPTPLWIPESHWRPGLSPPGALLRAEYGVVPFDGRVEELSDLEAWCGDGGQVGVRLYTGAGGMGKTRLALELCRRARRNGWEAGFHTQDSGPSAAASRLKAMMVRRKPLLVVVDYAEAHRKLLISLLREMYRLDQGKVRLLLLARAALGWWEALKVEGDGVGEILSGPATRWFTLQPLATDEETRQRLYRSAHQVFASHLKKPARAEAPLDLGAEFYERVLLLHMRALADVDEVPITDRDGLLDYILARERRFWERLATERDLPISLVEGIGRAVAAINLGGGALDEGHAVSILSSLRLFSGQDRGVLAQIARLLRDTYPGDNWIDPLLPDLLGEHLTRREMEKDPTELLQMTIKAAPHAE